MATNGYYKLSFGLGLHVTWIFTVKRSCFTFGFRTDC